MQTKAVLSWQIMPCDRIFRDGRVLRTIFTQPDGMGNTYFSAVDKFGLPVSFKCGPFERVQKIIDHGGFF